MWQWRVGLIVWFHAASRLLPQDKPAVKCGVMTRSAFLPQRLQCPPALLFSVRCCKIPLSVMRFKVCTSWSSCNVSGILLESLVKFWNYSKLFEDKSWSMLYKKTHFVRVMAPPIQQEQHISSTREQHMYLVYACRMTGLGVQVSICPLKEMCWKRRVFGWLT